MRFEQFNPKDFDELKEAFKKVFSKEPWYDKWDDEEQLRGYINDLTSNSNSLTFIMLDNSGRIVGGSLGYTFRWWQGSDYYIKEYFIASEIQGKGHGSWFAEEISKWLKKNDMKAMWLMTERDFPAYEFYKKNGFYDMEGTVVMGKSV